MSSVSQNKPNVSAPSGYSDEGVDGLPPTDHFLPPNLDLPAFTPLGEAETDAGIRRYVLYYP